MSAPRHRVIFVNRFFYPDEAATSILVSDLAFSLDKTVFEPHAIAGLSYYKRVLGRLESLEQVNGVTVHRVRTLRNSNGSMASRFMNFLMFYIGASIALLRHVRPGDTVVCMTDPPLSLIPVFIATSLRGGRLINWVQDVFPETATRLGYGNNLVPLIAPARIARDWTWRSADANVVLGSRMAQHLASHGVEKDAIRIVPNWAKEMDLVPCAQQIATLRERWGLKPNDFVVMYSGNLGRVHEIDTVLNCIELLSRRNIDGIKFLFVGGGAKTPFVREFVEANHIHNCIFSDFLDSSLLASNLAVADVHWMSLRSDLEGLVVPSKFYAASAVGRPIIFIGDPDGELALDIREADCGHSILTGRFEELADYILSLKGNVAECRRLGLNAKIRANSVNARSNRIQSWQEILLGAKMDRQVANIMQQHLHVDPSADRA